MNAVEEAISNALQAADDSVKINKAYLEFIKANFMIPIEKNSASSEPKVLYLAEEGHIFLPVFSNTLYFQQWALPIQDDISVLHLSGVDLLKGIGEQVTVSFNIGSTLYKEFNPGELSRMKSMVLKLFGNNADLPPNNDEND